MPVLERNANIVSLQTVDFVQLPNQGLKLSFSLNPQEKCVLEV
jgi:hypothetical protein